MSWNDMTVLITGGSGSFGRGITDVLLKTRKPRQLIIFSRDEQRQHAMRHFFGDRGGHIRYTLGDIRDRERLHMVMAGVDVVIHAAALKHVEDCEVEPLEAVKTNILGTENVVRAAIDRGVKKFFFLSTDKAVAPVNVYGASKMLGERIVAEASNHGSLTRCACMRSGNFIGSAGSVIPLFMEQRTTGTITVTDPRMTRFVITLHQAADFMLDCLERMQGGEVFVPKLPSVKILDLARVIAPECKIWTIGMRPGERLNEMFISEEEAPRAIDAGDRYVVLNREQLDNRSVWPDRPFVPEGFRYASDSNDCWLSDEQLNALLADFLQTSHFFLGRDFMD